MNIDAMRATQLYRVGRAEGVDDFRHGVDRRQTWDLNCVPGAYLNGYRIGQWFGRTDVSV